jgi:hypothetical protein
MKTLFYFFLTVASLSNLDVKAQENKAIKDSGLLQEVFVTATRTNTQQMNLPYSVAKEAAPSNSFRISRTTPEALMQTSGVFVQKTNHGGGSAFLRGLTGNQTLLLMDGLRINNATFRYGPNQYLNTIDPFSISSMEIVKGSGSVQYGSDAMGGVIQLFSYNPDFSSKRT